VGRAALAAVFGDGVKMGKLARDPLSRQFQPTRSSTDQDRGAAFLLSGDIR
jgi:hypothetical protein